MAVATAPAVDVERLVAASSLSALIDARAHLAQTELAALEAHLASVQADHDAAVADLVAFGQLVDRRASIRDRLLRDGLRVAARGGADASQVGSEELDAVGEQLALANALAERGARLAADEKELQATIESVTAKHAELARIDAEARLLANGETSASQLAVLQALADEASQNATAIGQLTKDATTTLTKDATGHATQGAWSWPVAGTVTQAFGPTALALEPPMVYGGAAFAHFHDAIDIAAPIGTPVLAAAAGRVTFVGHLPDGAMVVVIAHDDGLVSLSAHLDDAFAPPPVHAGDRVAAGQIVGYVGLTGITTGPHLHFSVHDVNGPVDPLVILSAR
ncbi:MAG TPA: peptidoglycan DD-metalloendopeptidase family protein [Candidatus Limnocylindria bacterium]